MNKIVETWIAEFTRIVPADRTPRIQGLFDARDWTRGTWPATYAAILAFLRERGDEAVDAGYDCRELLGVHRFAGAARVDSTGFLIQYRTATVAAITPESVTLSNGLVYRRRFNFAESVPIWDFRPKLEASSRR